MDPILIKPTRSTRASRPKVKSGCVTCKARHVKCDESKPFCSRCTAAGRQCGGYASPFRLKLPVASVEDRNSSSEDSRVASPRYQLQVGIHDLLGLPSRYEDRSYFDRFIHGSALHFSGFLTPDFWDSYVLRYSASSKVVQLAILALSGQNETYMLSKDPNNHSSCSVDQTTAATYSMWRYQEAIKTLNGQLHAALASSERIQELLLACFLFMGVELLRGDFLSALTHLEGGLGILSTNLVVLFQKSGWSWDIDPSMLDLVKMFHWLDVQTTSHIPCRVRLSPLSRTSALQTASTLTDYARRPFRNLSEARDTLDRHIAHIYHFIRTRAIPMRQQRRDLGRFVPTGPLPEEMLQRSKSSTYDGLVAVWDACQINIRALASWKANFETFLELNKWGDPSRPTTDAKTNISREPQEIALIWLAFYNNFIALSTCLEVAESAFDDHAAPFAAILRYATFIIMRPYGRLTPMSGSEDFALKSKAIQPLFYMTLKCRDSFLRMEAIDLLRSCNKEGPWDGDIEAAIAEHVMGMEESQR
ncbi:MAG: hypothetical protein L6R39_003973 [Caloplaca ligustica]|nr:MAG: hypothetical protein L6R39_003973 [Caloplaca ligustica]